MTFNRKVYAHFFILLSLISAASYARGSKDVEEKNVENMDSWQENFDLNKKGAGKYNIVVTATDLGGNQTVAGPYNIFIDPKSDLPVCGITNPHEGMRVVGNLNIVGTCVDDDAVDSVVLILDGDTDNPVKATGKEFWSYYLDTTNMTEGRHTIQVSGTDINGLAGKPVSLTWNLDRRQPVSEVTNYGVGTLVSGTVKFKGTITDGNGIKLLTYSLDAGKHFALTKISENKKENLWTFEIPVDTKKLPDGPTVLWLRSYDKTGSVGIYSYLCFIDNTKPEVAIVQPAEKEPRGGRFSVAGSAKDFVGIQKLSWTFGQESGDFELVPGNPYWSHEFDTHEIKDKSRKFTVSATDAAGNVTTVSRDILLNQELDKPVVDVSEPQKDALLDTTKEILVRGIASDNDGVQSVKYRIDGTEAGTQETKGVFCMMLDGTALAAGKHTLTVTAVDKYGTEGNPFVIPFTSEGPLAEFSTPAIITGKETLDVTDGLEVNPEAASSFQTKVSASSGITHVDWTFGSDAYSGASDMKASPVATVTIPFKADMPEGVVIVTVNATDSYNRVVTQKTLLHVKNMTTVTAEQPQVIFDDSAVGSDGAVTLNNEFPVTGYFVGGTITAVKLIPDSTIAQASFENNAIRIIQKADASGSSAETIVRVTAEIGGQKFDFDSQKMVFTAGEAQDFSSDPEALSAVIAQVNDEPYTSGKIVPLKFNAPKEPATLTAFVDSGSAVSSVAYEITSVSAAGLEVKQAGNAKLTKPEEGSFRWTANIPLVNLPVGTAHIKITAKAGKIEQQVTGSVQIVRPQDSVTADDERSIYPAPLTGVTYNESSASWLITTDTPFRYYANVSGPVTVSVSPAIAGLTASAEGKMITLSAQKDGIYKNVTLKVIENIADGMTVTHTTKPLNFVVDSAPPEVHVTEPALFAWVKQAVKISGTAADQIGVASVEYSTDGGETWKPFDIKAGQGVTFSGDIPLADMPEGLVRLDVRALDNAGHEAVFHTVVQKDTLPPDVTVVLPNDQDVVNGKTMIGFAVTDAGSLEKAQYVSPPVIVKKEEPPAPAKKGAKKTDKVEEKKTEAQQNRYDLEIHPLITTFIGTETQPISEAMSFEFTDAAGNIATVDSWKFTIESESDLPRAEIHVPAENEVVTRDFTVSGIATDDDGPSTIWYKIDDLPYQSLPEAGTSFSINVPISSLTDNEHTITVYAVDINGTKGPEAVRKIRVSLEEPKATVTAPAIDASVKGIIQIKGTASDKNSIAKVQVSLDNGNSYNDAVGTDNWTYTVDTRAVPDGSQVVFVKVFDKYGIEGLYSSLLSVDNKNPELYLELPLDDSKTSGTLFFSGNALDNVNITEMHVSIRSLEQKSVPKQLSRVDLKPERIITDVMDVSALENGFYNIELSAIDRAGNITRVSRNIEIDKSRPPAEVDIMYPFDGEHKQGVFTIYGQVTSEQKIQGLHLYIDDKESGEAELTESNFFKFDVKPEMITAGKHTYRVDALLPNNVTIHSRAQVFDYTPAGPWVVIENFTYGDFATNRPYINGTAGYSIDTDELLSSRIKGADPELKRAVSLKKVAKVELSLDNGKTFILLSNKEKWRYRIENKDLDEGYHFLLVRATMMNGEIAITRTIVQIDNTSPRIRLVSPSQGGRYNQNLEFSGLTSDDVKLSDVKVALRKGDKAAYEVPSFIQGLYFDWSFWGATLFSIGAGLSFFDDNVKLQVQWGQFTQEQRNIFIKSDMRYGGNSILGLKILANVGRLPFSYFFGHDFEWLAANFALGANFTYFNQTNSGRGQILSALVGQIEFPQITLAKLKRFRKFSLYTEGSLWFIPTDVSSTNTSTIKNLVPQLSEGIRINVF